MRPQLIGCAQEPGVLNFGLRVCKQWREMNMWRQEGNQIVF